MKSLVVITRDCLDLDKLANGYKSDAVICTLAGNRLVMEGPWGWFALDCDDSLLQEFDEIELQLLERTFSTMSFAQLRFNTIEAANYAILYMELPDDSLIDNDHGLITSISHVYKLIQDSIDWTMLNASSSS